MNVLLIDPKCPVAFWSFTYGLSFIGKKAAFPPLDLLTVAIVSNIIMKGKCDHG